MDTAVTGDQHAHGVADELSWCASRLNIWSRRGEPPTPELRRAAAELTASLQAAGLADDQRRPPDRP